MHLPLDHIAIAGYAMLFVHATTMLGVFAGNPLDLVASMLLLAGLAALIAFHVRKIKMGVDESSDTMQRRLRVAAHAALATFVILTATTWSRSTFRAYDTLALAAHVMLLIAVLEQTSQTLGVALLAAYFGLATLLSGTADVMQIVGRSIMTVFFVGSLLQA